MSTACRPSTSVLAVLAAASLSACSGSTSTPPPSAPALALAPTSLSFTATVAGADPAAQAVTVSNGGSGALAVPTASIAYTTGSGWLTATVSGTAQPYTVTVQPTTGSLGAGIYEATVAVDSAGASNTPRTFPVTFTVTGGAAPAIGLSPTTVTFAAVTGGADPPAKTVTVSNLGGGSLAAPTASVTYTSGADWLTATVSGATAPYTITVQPATAGLAAGTYEATVSVASAGAANTPQSFGVSFTVTAPPAIGLTPASLSFTATAGGADPAAKVVSVSNTGGGTLAAPTTSITYTSGTGWLAATVSGTSAPYMITVQPRVGALAQGTYEATVSVASTGATNTPQTFLVSFVVGAAVPPAIGLSATSLSFAATFGGPNPAPQAVTVSNTGGGTFAAPTTSITYTTGTGWLTAAVSGSAVPYTITVRPATGALAIGSYEATVSVVSVGASNTPQTFGVSFAVVAAPPPCLDAGASCSAGSECCSATCAGTPSACTTDAFCAAGGAPCATDADCCSVTCTGAGTPGATCAAEPCGTIGSACSDGSTCCSGVCDVGNTDTCLELPGGTCTTLGERCDAPLECCSQNCQGGNYPATPEIKDGWCTPAYTCNATGDVCWRPEDCCSGLCTAAGGAPGRCDDASGGCTQDGVPCDNDSNCCTRLCVDLGSGTKVCQPAGGCRMTGDYCDSTDACCNINNLVPEAQAVECLAEHTCDNGGACNPPGNICGASTDVNASQNCCNGKKDVCKPDSNGILRCFGGQTVDCPTGWDANDPSCCIPPGTGPESICQFRDQCCGGAPCVPDATGVLHCSAPAACVPRGDVCDLVSPDACCEGTTCVDTDGVGHCEDAFVCVADGAACSTTPATPADACCSGLCVPSAPGSTTGTCGLCAPNGNACSHGSQCCSGTCDPELGCVAPCVGDAGVCTVDADCCAGLACNVPPGDTSGTCGLGGTCAATGQTCGVDTDCCNFATGETCVAGACTPPSTCSSAAQSCTLGGGECCAGLACLEAVPDPSNPPDGTMTVDCTAGGTCFCDVAACVPQASDCTNNLPCCAGSTCTVTGYPLFPCPDPPDPEQPCTCTASP